MNKLRTYFLYVLGLPKTIYFNFKYLPFSQALKLPVFVSHRVWLKQCKGRLKIASDATASVKIGYGGVSIFDEHRSRSIWNVSGNVEFKGTANIGHGSKLAVTGNLEVGDNLEITAEGSIICHKQITLGKNALISWDTLIMDSDFHEIYDEHQQCINENSPVTIGDDVWIGCRVLILKGVDIPDGTIIAASSTVNKPIGQSHSIIAGSPAKSVKQNVSWKY